MKITLIEPAMIKTRGFSEKPSWQLIPLSLATLAGMTPPDVEVEAIDDRIDQKLSLRGIPNRSTLILWFWINSVRDLDYFADRPIEAFEMHSRVLD